MNIQTPISKMCGDHNNICFNKAVAIMLYAACWRTMKHIEVTDHSDQLEKYDLNWDMILLLESEYDFSTSELRQMRSK